MLPQDFATVNEAYLLAMCVEQRRESQTLDFKRALPTAGSPGWREEVAKDVCAFANADGGDIVYGIVDRDARAEAVVPIAGERQDAAARRLREAADDLVQPRVIGMSIEVVAVAGGYVLVLRVPQSFNGPHGYVYSGDVLRFPVRVGTGTADMTYEQLRTAFDRMETLRDRAGAFRRQQVQKLIAGQTWRAMPDGPLAAVHMVPLQATLGNDLIDVRTLYRDFHQFIFAGWGNASRVLHLDGLTVYSLIAHDSPVPAYTQVFRTGAMETVRRVGREIGGARVIASGAVAPFIRDAAVKFLGSARALGLKGPAIFGAVLLNIEGYDFLHSSYEGPAHADRPHLVLPDVWVDRIDAADNEEAVWRPTCDLLWQCFDLERCPLFDEEVTAVGGAPAVR